MPIDPNTGEEVQHPLEVILEAQTLQNEEIKNNGDETNALLGALIAQGESDNDSLLEARIAQADQHNKELKEALKESTFNFQIDGVEMASITGPQGEKGDKGDKGDDGAVSLEMPDGTIEKREGKIVVKGLKGEKGDKGDKGEKGADGKDGKDGKVIIGANGRNGIDGINGVDGIDGKDGSPDTPKQIKKKLESLKDDERLDIKALKGIDKIEKDIKKAGQFVQTYQQYDVNGTLVGNGTRLNLKEGTGVTLSGVPTSNGIDLTINASGGGAVDSVNGQTGVVVLDTGDIAEATNANYVSDAQLVVIGNTSGTNTGDVTVSDSAEIDFTLTGQQISASIVAGSIDETKLDTSVNTSLDKADSALQSADATTTPTASKIVQRDASANIYVNNYFANTASTVSAGGTTILTVASARTQNLTGSSNQTFQLPDATTLALSSIFEFNNNSSGSLIVTNAGATTQYTVPAGGAVVCYCTSISTSNGTWDFHALAPLATTWSSGVTGLIMNSVLTTSPRIGSGASSSTAPSFIPQRGASTTGFGGDGTDLHATIAGTPRLTISSTGITATNLSGTNTGDQTITLSGDISGSGTGAITTTIGAGKVTEAMQVLADNTTNDVSTSKHGYAPKGDGSTTKFLNANGAYSTPASAAFDPTTTQTFFDDFMMGNETSGSIGEMGWSSQNIAGTTTFNVSSQGSRTGNFRLTTGATDNNGGVISAGGGLLSGSNQFPMAVGNRTIIFSVKPANVSDVCIRCGLASDAQNDAISTGIYFELNTDVNANWRGACNGATTTYTASSTAPSTSYKQFKIVFNSDATSIEFFVDGSSIGAVTTNITGDNGEPFFQVLTRTAGAKSGDIDYFYMTTTGLSR